MFKFFRHVIRGAGYLEGYGHHPGTFFLIMFSLIGGLAGAQNGGLIGLLAGFVITFVVTLPFYIIGCVDRSKGYDRDQQKLLKLIKES